MLTRSIREANTILLCHNKRLKLSESKRNVQISVVGAAGEIGSNVSLLLKLNNKVTALHLYDDDDKVKGVGMELAHVPGGPKVKAFAGERKLGPSIRGSNIIVMTFRTPRKQGRTREEMMADHALAIKNICRAMMNNNRNAFLAISTNPVNCIIPFASALLCDYNSYNPCKVFGITNIDSARSRALAGNALQVNPRTIDLPVIGGHSDETIVPLFSNLSPGCYTVDTRQVDTLTRLVRKAGTEVIMQKKGVESALLAVAWAVHEFVDGLVDAVCGHERVLNCYTVNPHFGTRFFSGPTTVGQTGIKQACHDFKMSNYEIELLQNAIPVINRDIQIGEDYVQYIANLGKYW